MFISLILTDFLTHVKKIVWLEVRRVGSEYCCYHQIAGMSWVSHVMSWSLSFTVRRLVSPIHSFIHSITTYYTPTSYQTQYVDK